MTNLHANIRICGPGQLSRYSDSLRTGRSRDRIPVGVKFSAPFQTCPGAHPASCTMGTGSSPGVKRPRRGVDHPSPFSAEVKERVIHLLPFRPSWPVVGKNFTFYFDFLCVIYVDTRCRPGIKCRAPTTAQISSRQLTV